jgi:hypothetical protein
MELEKIFELKVGQLRELFAYEDADDTVGDVWDYVDENTLERVGFYENDGADDDYEDEDDTCYDEDDEIYEDDEEEDYDDEDEDYYDEDEEDDLDLGEDEVCVGGVLPNPYEEELAQSIAEDIRNGRYALHTLNGVYSVEILNRISELI